MRPRERARASKTFFPQASRLSPPLSCIHPSPPQTRILVHVDIAHELVVSAFEGVSFIVFENGHEEKRETRKMPGLVFFFGLLRGREGLGGPICLLGLSPHRQTLPARRARPTTPSNW